MPLDEVPTTINAALFWNYPHAYSAVEVRFYF